MGRSFSVVHHFRWKVEIMKMNVSALTFQPGYDKVYLFFCDLLPFRDKVGENRGDPAMAQSSIDSIPIHNRTHQLVRS